MLPYPDEEAAAAAACSIFGIRAPVNPIKHILGLIVKGHKLKMLKTLEHILYEVHRGGVPSRRGCRRGGRGVARRGCTRSDLHDQE